jgi:hypothetical protein
MFEEQNLNYLYQFKSVYMVLFNLADNISKYSWFEKKIDW